MSFYITIKEAKLSLKHQDSKHRVGVVITSKDNRLFSSFTDSGPVSKWDDAFVAQSTERDLEFMLVKQKQSNKSAKRLSSNTINLSKYIFLTKDQADEIPLYAAQGNHTDTLTIQICYQQNKHFIGPIQFYKKGVESLFDEDDDLIIEVQGDNTKFPFWKRWFSKNQDSISAKSTNILHELNEKEKVKFYKGPHINRNFFSLCDQVHDDQKFTVVENYYNDQ